MTSADKPAFFRFLAHYALLWKQSLCEEELEMWFGLLAPLWTLDEFRSAAGVLALKSQFMPRLFDFDQLRKAGRTTAAEAWEKARKACGSCVQGGHYTDRGTCGDEVIDAAVAGMGGYKVIAQCNTDALHFLERRFSEKYEEQQNAVDVRQALPQVTRHARLVEAGELIEELQRELAQRRDPPPLTKVEPPQEGANTEVLSEWPAKRR